MCTFLCEGLLSPKLQLGLLVAGVYTRFSPDVLVMQEIGSGAVSDLRGYQALRRGTGMQVFHSHGLAVEESPKSDQKEVSNQRHSEGKGKSVTKALDLSHFLAPSAQRGPNQRHHQTGNDRAD